MTTEVKIEQKPLEATAITEASVFEKVQKGEALNEKETELLKSIPPGGLPTPPAEGEAKEPGTAASEPSKKTEEKKPAESSAPAAATTEVPEDRKKIILEELDKPDNLVDLSKFKSQIELGLYWDLKKARRKNQKLEEELEVVRVTKIVSDLKTKETKPPEEGAPAAEEDPLKILAGRDPDDILTVADVLKILAPRKKTEAAPAAQPIRTIDQLRVEKIEADSRLRAKGIEDFHDVVDFAEDALKGDDDAIAILRDTAKSGGNTAEKTYWLIKGSNRWPAIEKKIVEDKAKANSGKAPVAKKDPPAEHVERVKKIAENDEKIKTTGAGDGAGTEGEYTVEEIRSMTVEDVKRLPKKTRLAILQKYGSNPNYSV